MKYANKKWLCFFVTLIMLFVCVSCSQEIEHNSMPTGIALSEYNISLEVGDTYTLGYELQPSGTLGTVTFTSSDYSIVNIIEEKLVGISAGTATITVETENHIISACNVTVTNKPAMEQMSECEIAFYNILLSHIDNFNVPSSVRVIRVKSIDENGEKYLAMIQANNLLGTTLSNQYIITPDEIEKTSEIIQNGDQRFSVELINQALEEYWGIDSNVAIENIQDMSQKDESLPNDEIYINQRENCDFRNCKWGDTREEVKLYDTTITVISDKNDTLMGTDNVSGYSDTGVLYRFDENGNLYQGIYGFSYKKKEVWEYISMYSSLVEKLTEVYGEPIQNEILPFTMQSLIDLADPVTAVQLGYVGYYAKWETATSTITLMLATENYKTQLALTYTDVNYQESSNNNGL